MRVNWQSTGPNVPDDLNLHQHRCENFTTTVVPKRRQETTNRCYVKSQNSSDLIYTASEAWNHATVEVLVFCYQHAKRMHRLRLAWCFLCCVVHMYGGHFRYKKIIPQQVKGKKKWLKSITCWGCLWWTFTVKNRTLQCASFFQILCCVCSEDIMALIWNFLKSQACIQNTLQLVNSSYHCFDQWKCIIQKVNKTQLKLGVCAVQTLLHS